MPYYDGYSLPALEMNIQRTHGTHRFKLTDRTAVTAISQPSWEAFAGALETVEDPGSHIVSPELITVSPEPTAEEMAAMPDVVAGRVDHVRRLSRRFPETTVLLGSLTFATPRPRNELLFIRNGEQIGQTPKMPYLESEAAVFHQAYNPAEQQQPDRQTLAMICSDLIFHRERGEQQFGLPYRNLGREYVNPVHFGVRRLLVSALWIAPVDPAMGTAYEEARFVRPLRHTAGAFFQMYPHLTDIVMADQMPPDRPFSGPVNFHARRA